MDACAAVKELLHSVWRGRPRNESGCTVRQAKEWTHGRMVQAKERTQRQPAGRLRATARVERRLVGYSVGCLRGRERVWAVSKGKAQLQVMARTVDALPPLVARNRHWRHWQFPA